MATGKPNQGASQGASKQPNQGAWLNKVAAAGGWTHDFMGVANANIGKINGVLKANISKVNGVS